MNRKEIYVLRKSLDVKNLSDLDTLFLMALHYERQEDTLAELYDLVEENPEFFDSMPGDNKLERALEKLKIIVEAMG